MLRDRQSPKGVSRKRSYAWRLGRHAEHNALAVSKSFRRVIESSLICNLRRYAAAASLLCDQWERQQTVDLLVNACRFGEANEGISGNVQRHIPAVGAMTCAKRGFVNRPASVERPFFEEI